MPAKNSLKLYCENGYYHIYNRGVDKCPTFIDDQDYRVFLSYLKDYLSLPQPLTLEELAATRPHLNKNYYQKITLLAFVLMPNHFHLLLKQKEPRCIEGFMRSLLTRYVKYFNKRHGRVGHLFQDVYKGTLVEKDEYLWWLSRYLHRNPNNFGYPYSSYSMYLGKINLDWVHPEEILAQVKDYRNFVEDDKKNQEAPELLADLSLENDNVWV